MKKIKLENTEFGRYLISTIRSYFLEKKYYNNNNAYTGQEEDLLIYMADGKTIHGGLCDRLWGMVSLFNYCTDNNKHFKIHFVSPFMLENFLMPNEYDWTIEPNNITYNKKYARPFVMLGSNVFQNKFLLRWFKVNKKQLHIYTNSRYNRERFSDFFHVLFKPTPLLQEHISEHLKNIGDDFISITFRFQQLLGDFSDNNLLVLSEDEQEKFIKRCLSVIPSIKERHQEMKKILVTSDSGKFIERVQIFDYVYVISGERLHPDYNINNDGGGYLNVFLDLYLIANAQKVYFVRSAITYAAQFAKTAAAINNRPYEVVRI
jgi:hypothetical protein